MNPGGDAADALVKMYLNGTEMMIRLSGSFLKNLLALTVALAKDHKKVSGKINLAKMLRETRDLRTFTMTPAQYKAFKRLAKKQGILFAAVTDKDDKGKLVDVILPATELDRANLLFERILYDPNLGPESPEPPQPEKKHWWQRIFHREKEEPTPEPEPEREPAPILLEEGRERENPTRPTPEAFPEHWEERWPDIPVDPPEVITAPPPVIPLGLPAPEGEARVEEPLREEQEMPPREEPEGAPKEEAPKEKDPPQAHDGPPRESAAAQPEPARSDAPPSRPDLPDTRGKSPSPDRTADTRTTSERPSVLKRLERYRAQLDQRKAPAREKGNPERNDAQEKPSGGRRRVADRNARKSGTVPKPAGKGGKRLAKPVR